MKHPLSFLGGFVAGLGAMYYLDGVSGASRRARLREMLSMSGGTTGRIIPPTDMQPEDASGGDAELETGEQGSGRAVSPGGTPWH